jgi:membrane-associated protein
MDFLDYILKALSKPDEIISLLINKYDNWIYVILFFIIFAETGLIIMSFIMPFLPGDALIFAIGMIAAKGELDIYIIIPLLIFAAMLGDNVNYIVGKKFGSWILNREKKFLIKPSHINKAKEFFDQKGKNAIIMARFIPVVRTIVPFICGSTNFTYKIFLLYSFIGAVLWVGCIAILGYFLGQFQFVKDNLDKFIILIIILANFPLIKQIFLNFKNKKKKEIE